MDTEPENVGGLRSRLLEAGQQVFAVSGYASATVDDIITTAGTSRASFYRYFKSKGDLFDALSRACFREMRALTEAIGVFDTGGDGRAGLERLVVAYTEMQQRQRGVVRAWMEQVDRPEWSARKEAALTFQALLSGLEQRIAAASQGSAIDPDVQAALLVVLLNRATFYVLHRHSRMDPNDLAPTLATMVHRAYFGAASERRGRLRVATN